MLIVLNVLVYVAMFTGLAQWVVEPDELELANAVVTAVQGRAEPRLAEAVAVAGTFAAVPGESPWWTWLTSLFTHSPRNWLHLVGNMIFLWAFGKPVESHIGFWRFLCLYLLGGIAGTCGHWLVSGGSVIGASGATTATAAMLVTFFPRSHTKLFFLLGFSVLIVPSFALVVTYVLIDLITLLFARSGLRGTDVAVGAHLGGAVFGVAAGLVLLRLGVVPRGEWDLLHLLKQARRRRAMRAAMRQGSPLAKDPARPNFLVDPATPAAAREAAGLRAAQRQRVLDSLRANEPEKIVTALRTFLSTNPNEALPQGAQLDAANFALERGDVGLAASAYALYLSAYPKESNVPAVRLLLASLYARRLQRRDEARALLTGLAERLHIPDQRILAESLAAECALPTPRSGPTSGSVDVEGGAR